MYSFVCYCIWKVLSQVHAKTSLFFYLPRTKQCIQRNWSYHHSLFTLKKWSLVLAKSKLLPKNFDHILPSYLNFAEQILKSSNNWKSQAVKALFLESHRISSQILDNSDSSVVKTPFLINQLWIIQEKTNNRSKVFLYLNCHLCFISKINYN